MKSTSAFAFLFPLLCVFVSAQTTPPSSIPAIKLPAAMTEVDCHEGQCAAGDQRDGTWTFHGWLGEGEWNDGASATLVIKQFDADGIEIRRIDLPNSSSYGLTAVYTGTLHGNRIEGSVVWSWSGHWDGTHPIGKWSATLEGVRPAPPLAVENIPHLLTECEADQCVSGHEGGCYWEFHGSEGNSRCRNGAIENLEVRQFDADGVVIFRTDHSTSVSDGLTAVYAGTMRGHQITGYGTWSWPGHWSNRNPGGRWSATVVDGEAPGLPPVPPPFVSPEVHQDGSVTFRAFAPRSLEVFLELEGEKQVIMQKDDQGIWSITTAPLQPDYYGYIFNDTGLKVIDPLNPLILPNYLQTENMVHVPGPRSLPWEVNDVPHGVVHHHTYTSKVIGDVRDFYVYTPPGYDAVSEKEYPVLYLLHGYGQESSSWTEVAFANVILDNLIAQGKAKPMIVVMPVAYGGPELLASRGKLYWNDEIRGRNFNMFTQGLLTEVIPQVEREYRAKKDRDSRAIAGLSMGGAESLLAGLNHLDEFSWIGSFSSGGVRENFDQEFPGLNASANDKLHLLWVACGTDDPLNDINLKINKWLRSKGIAHTEIETPGAHTWMVWRRNLANFAPLLFR